MKLFLCPGCNRHVRGEAACPFCGEEREGTLVGDSATKPSRISRARTVLGVTAGAAAVALAMTGCGSEAMYGCVCPPYGQPPPVDAAAEAQSDAGATDADATQDAGGDEDAPAASDGADE